MKKKTAKLLSVILALMLIVCTVPNMALTSFAEITSGTCGDNLTWEYDTSTYTLTISGTGAMTDYSTSSYGGTYVTTAPWRSYYKTMKTVVINSGVTSIGNSAFYRCTGLTSVTIPDSVTSIGREAFYGCTSLNKVNISDIAAWCNISFGGSCSNPLEYAHNLYLNNKLVTDLVIPNGVTSIGSYAFYRCTGLTSITIPNSVTSIGYYAFSGCTGLTSITIPDSVTNIGNHAFDGCTGLTSITIPDSVTSVGYSAFYGCKGLNTVYYPAPYEHRLKIAVSSYNNSLTDANWMYNYVGEGGIIARGICGEDLTWTLDSEGVLTVSGAGDMDNYSSASYYLPWYSYLNSIKTIIIPNGVTSIGNSAFSGCTGLTTVTIPDSITSIGNYAFYNCTGLTSITIPDSVTSIGGMAFCCCAGLTSVTIPDSVTSIGINAFSDCGGLTSVTIGNGVTSIGSRAFRACTGLTSITIPDSVTSIGSGAFYFCTGLISITIPDSVKSIGDSAFYRCTGLTSVTIPDSVKSIGDSAFEGCTSLDRVNISDVAAWCNISFATYNSNPLCYAHNLYLNNELVTDLVIPNGVTSIGQAAFYRCTGLKTITIGNSVTSIGSSAFEYCTGLTSITIPNSVTSIGYYAFSGCTGLTSIIIPKSVTSIGQAAFHRCTGLKTITIGNSVTSIGSSAFEYCTGLTSITIPNSVTSIGYYAFSGCTGLTSIIIPKSVTSIGSSAFYGCTYLSIKCYPNSYAETYAINNSIGCSYIFKSVSPSIMQAAPTPINQTGAVFVDYKTGKYIIDDLTASFSANRLYASKTGYYTVNISPYPYADTSVSGKKLTLVPESTKSGICAVYCNNTDVLSNSVSIEDNSANTVNIKVYPASGYNIGKFQLMHQTTPIAESYDGSFSINASTLQASSEYYVRLVNSAGRTYNKIKIGLSVTRAVDIDIDLGDIACFTIPESVPVIGGEDINISLSNLPFAVFTKGDSTFVTIIGTGFDYVSEEYSVSRIMKQLEEAGKDYSKAKELLKKSGKSKKFETFGGSLSVDLNVALCAELKIDSNGLRPVAGKALISLEGSGSHEFQAYAIVPIVVKAKLMVGASMQATLGLDSRNALYLNTNAEFTLPKVTLSAGVGLTKVADISVYGSASNIINIDFVKKITTATLKGEIGLSAKVFFASTKLKFFSGEWQYYNSASVAKRSNMISPMLSIAEFNEKTLDINNYTIDRSHLETQSEWQSTPQKRMLNSKSSRDISDNYSATEIKELQTDVYNNAVPKTVTLNSGKQIMVWTADIANRDDNNCTAAVYSVYDPMLEYWSEPKIIDDNGTADSYVDIATDGETVYAAWCDENIVFENTPTIEDLASHSEIKYAAFNSEEDTFCDAVYLTNDELYDAKPKAFVNNGAAYITWVKNSDNSPIVLSGSNTLFYAILSDETQINELTEENTPITEYNTGILNENLTIFYCKDTDGDLTTSDDIQLLLGGLNGEFSAYESPSDVGNVQFIKLNGTNRLMYYKNNSVYGINAVGDTEELLIENIDTYDFTVVSNDDSCAIICSKDNDFEDADGSYLYAYIYNDGCFSAPVQITDNSGYVINANGYIDNNGNLRVVFVRKDIEFNEENFIEHSAICDAKIVPNYDLSLVEIDYSDEGIEIGDNMSITYTIKNSGLFDIESYTVSVIDTEDSIVFERTINEQILIGEERTESVEFEFPNISKLTSYTFKISPNNVYDGLIYNNTCDLFIGHSNISVNVEKTVSGCGNAMQISVQNNGRTDENLMLYIYDGDSSGKVLDVCDLGLIRQGESLNYEYVAQYMRQLNNEESVIYVEVKCDNSENYLFDNGSYVSYKTVMLELTDGKEVEYYFDVNNDGEFNIIDLIVLKKMMVNADENQQGEEADLNGDLELNSLDAIVMIKKLLL